jgi:hypothetical protein
MRSAVLVLALVTWATSSQAGAITSVNLTDCDADGCDGSDLFLSVEEEAGGSWLVTYTIDTSAYTGSRSGLNQIGFKAVADWTDATLIEADPDLASWSDPIEAPVNANSLCGNSKGNSSKVCSYGFVDITGGGQYTWKFRLEGGTLLDTADWHLGAQYADSAGATSGKIISTEPGGTVPEPTGALLFGAGVVVLRSARRRRE